MRIQQIRKVIQQEIALIKEELSVKHKLKGGLADGMTIADLAKHHKVSLKVILQKAREGANIEKEHTDNLDIAYEIALDHIYEDLDYYDKLNQIERSNRLV